MTGLKYLKETTSKITTNDVPKSFLNDLLLSLGFMKPYGNYVKPIYAGGSIAVSIDKGELFWVYHPSSTNDVVPVGEIQSPVVIEYFLEHVNLVNEKYDEIIALRELIDELVLCEPVSTSVKKHLNENNLTIVLSNVGLSLDELDSFSLARPSVLYNVKRILGLRTNIVNKPHRYLTNGLL